MVGKYISLMDPTEMKRDFDVRACTLYRLAEAPTSTTIPLFVATRPQDTSLSAKNHGISPYFPPNHDFGKP